MINKVIRDGFVAVLVSPGWGAGWSTWANSDMAETLLFEPDVVAWVESGKLDAFPDLQTKYGKKFYFPINDLEDLEIQWVPVGTRFRIEEYDGSESLRLEHEITWQTA